MENLIDAITELVDTLNAPSNINLSEWILVGITAIYVIATILICVFNYRSAKAATAQVTEMKNIQQQNADIQLFEKRHEVYYVLWRWCDISKTTFDDLVSPIEVFQQQFSHHYACHCEIFYAGHIISFAKFLYPFECGKAEEFRNVFVDATHETTEENLQKLKASFGELEKSNLLEKMKKCLKLQEATPCPTPKPATKTL